MIARQPAIDLGDDAIPVGQHVESDDRRHHQKRHEIDQGHAAREDRGQQRDDPTRRAAGKIRNRTLYAGFRFRQHLAQPGRGQFVEAAGKSLYQGRQIAGELGDLVAQHRHDQHEAQHKNQNADQHDGERRRQARQAEALQRVGHGIEEIGEHQPGDERQQNIAEQPQHEDQRHQRRDPDGNLLLQVHGCRVSLPPLAIWRSHSAR